MKAVLIIAGLLIGGYILISLLGNRDKWSLLVCESMMDASQCQTNALEVNEIATKEACLNLGRFNVNQGYPGFECGFGCRYESSVGSLVCKELYNSRGVKTSY